MSDKNEVEQLRTKLHDNKVEALSLEAQKQIEQELPNVVHDMVQDGSKKGRHFLMVQVRYNLETGKASVTGVKPFNDKTAGISMVADKTNREYLYNKCKKGE